MRWPGRPLIAVLAATPDYKRRILAAGEMRELGTTSPELHREAGAFAAQTGKIDWVIGVAGDGGQIVEGALLATALTFANATLIEQAVIAVNRVPWV